MKPALIATTLISILSLMACGEKSAPPPPSPTVEVVSVAQRDVPVYMEWIGSLDGNVNAVIRPQVTGYLIKQNYREGDLVKQGQPLFEIDPRTFEAAVDEAKGQRAQQVARYETASANLARIKPLADLNAVSKKDLDDATGSYLSAKAQLEAAEAALKTAKLNLGFTRITSPVTGIAGIAKAQIGDLLSPSMATELTTVSTVDPIKVYFNISEREYLKIANAAIAAGSKPENGSARTLPGGRLALSAPRQGCRPQPAGRYDHRHVQGGCPLPQSQQSAAPGPVRQGTGDHVGRQGRDAGAATGGHRNPGQVRGGSGRRRQQGRYPAGDGRRTGRYGVGHHKGLQPGEQVIAEGTQKARPGATVTPKPFVAGASPAKPAEKAAAPAPAGKE